MENLKRRVRILEAYAVLSLLVVGVLAFGGFAQTKQRFDGLTVERLNLVEKNGQLVAVLANRDRMPDPITNGRSFKTERPQGMIFYNVKETSAAVWFLAPPAALARGPATNMALMAASVSINISSRRRSA